MMLEELFRTKKSNSIKIYEVHMYAWNKAMMSGHSIFGESWNYVWLKSYNEKIKEL